MNISMTSVITLCLVVCSSAFLAQKPQPPSQAPPEVTDSDVHTDSEVKPALARFDKKTGKKLKQKKTKGTWQPKNVITTAAPTFSLEEMQNTKEQRLFAEFNDVHHRMGENYVVALTSELNGLDTFQKKVSEARNFIEMETAASDLGEVGQTIFRKFPDIKEDLMVEEKEDRQKAARLFMAKVEETKKALLEEKIRVHSKFLLRSKDTLWTPWVQHNEDKARRLQEYDEIANRRKMRGSARRPLGEGKRLPGPNDDHEGDHDL